VLWFSRKVYNARDSLEKGHTVQGIAEGYDAVLGSCEESTEITRQVFLTTSETILRDLRSSGQGEK
jgi:hypothetical protein